MFSFRFPCQRGGLEVKALLLAASLLKSVEGDYEMIAVHPRSLPHQEPSAATLDLLQSLGVKVRNANAPQNTDDELPNKLACIKAESTAETTVYLDSNLLAVRPFRLPDRSGVEFAIKPADQTIHLEYETWETIYSVFDLPMTTQRIWSTQDRSATLPYYDTNVILLRNSTLFAQTWHDTAKRIARLLAGTPYMAHLDQISLPVTLERLGIRPAFLPQKYNFPGHRRPLHSGNQTVLCRYNRPEVIANEPTLRQLVQDICERWPGIAAALEGTEWHRLSKKKAQNFVIRPNDRSYHRDFFISGIPRSGTSLLCHLLHKHPNCIVINEPKELFSPLRNQAVPWEIALMYRQLRSHVLWGETIENKIDAKGVIQDTAINDQRMAYRPAVTRPDFLLGTKNTLGYLLRQHSLNEVLPQSRWIYCVRHPYDTIASWKRTFPHLRQVMLENFPACFPGDPHMTAEQIARFSEIEQANSNAEKRALLWRYLAETILESGGKSLIIKYEALVGKTDEVLQETRVFLSASSNPTDESPKLKVRSRHAELTDMDKTSIRQICHMPARALGYRLD